MSEIACFRQLRFSRRFEGYGTYRATSSRELLHQLTSTMQSRCFEYCLEQIPDEDYLREENHCWRYKDGPNRRSGVRDRRTRSIERQPEAANPDARKPEMPLHRCPAKGQHPERVNCRKEAQRSRQCDADCTGWEYISSAAPSDGNSQGRRVDKPSDQCEP